MSQTTLAFDDLPEILPGRKIEARLEILLIGDGPGFSSRPVEVAELDFEGMAGDGHRGFTRKSGGREPWYPRKTEMRSGRQLSVLSVDELNEVAGRLSLPALDPGLIGGNLVLSGVGHLSFLPAGTRMFFAGGASIVVEAQNGPCRFAGAAIAEAHPGREDIALGFVEAAKRRRGVVASVERPGRIEAGSVVAIKIPDQWIWRG